MSMWLDPMTAEVLSPRDAAHPNPMFDFLTGFIPRRLKDLFRWAEYLAYSSAHIYAVIKKFGEYPITRFIYETESDKEKERHKEFFERHARVKGFLTKVSFDKFLYGNVFVSMYEPFKRYLKCTHCKSRHAADIVEWTYDPDRVLFKFQCPEPRCKAQVSCRPDDQKLLDPSRITLIRWDPKAIDIEHNPVTNQSIYYYNIPEWLRTAVRRGARNMVNTMPYELLLAMKKDKVFKFAPDQLYHLRVPGPSGVEEQWGFPPITSAIKLFLFAATLRKANEAIAMEHITPMRVLYPQANGQNGDPISNMNLGLWKDEVERNYRRFRRDPLHVMISPTPIGVEDIGGNGRALLTLGEVQEAEKNIVLSLGVPMEFITGGLGQVRGEITLRQIENQLQTHIEDLNDLIQWIENKASRFLNYKSIKVRLADFKMIDDVENKQMLFSLWQAKKVSDTRMAEALNLDLEAERKQMMEDQLADARMQMKLQVLMDKLQNSLSSKAQQQAAASQGGAPQYDQQQMRAAAEQTAQPLMQLDEGSRQSRLIELEKEDWPMYCMVRDVMEQAKTDQDAQARAQARGAPVQ